MKRCIPQKLSEEGYKAIFLVCGTSTRTNSAIKLGDYLIDRHA